MCRFASVISHHFPSWNVSLSTKYSQRHALDYQPVKVLDKFFIEFSNQLMYNDQTMGQKHTHLLYEVFVVPYGFCFQIYSMYIENHMDMDVFRATILPTMATVCFASGSHKNQNLWHGVRIANGLVLGNSNTVIFEECSTIPQKYNNSNNAACSHHASQNKE